MTTTKHSTCTILVALSCFWSVVQGEGRYMDEDSKYNSIKLPSSYNFYMLTTTDKPPFEYHVSSGDKGFKLVIDTNPTTTSTTKAPSTEDDEEQKDNKVDVEVGDMSDSEVQLAVDRLMNSMEKDGTLKAERFTHIRPLLKELTPVYNSMRGLLRDKERAKILATRLRNRFRERRRRLLLSRVQHPRTPVITSSYSRVTKTVKKTPNKVL